MYLWTRGEHKVARDVLPRVAAKSEKVLRADRLNTLTSVSNLAVALRDRGKYNEAELLRRRVVQSSKEVLGANHLSTLKLYRPPSVDVPEPRAMEGGRGAGSESNGDAREGVSGRIPFHAGRYE